MCTRPGVSFPELLQTRGEYQIKPPLPVHPGQRGRRHRASAPPRRQGQGRGPRGGFLRARRGWRRDGGRRRRLQRSRCRRSRLRAGRGADPQLRHRVFLAARCAGGCKRARRCSSTAAAGGVGTASLAGGARAAARGRRGRCPSEEKAAVAAAGGRRRGRGGGATAGRSEVKRRSDGGVDVVRRSRSAATGSHDSLRALREGGRRGSWWASPAARSPKCA